MENDVFAQLLEAFNSTGEGSLQARDLAGDKVPKLKGTEPAKSPLGSIATASGNAYEVVAGVRTNARLNAIEGPF